jgi:hypothetical protein
MIFTADGYCISQFGARVWPTWASPRIGYKVSRRLATRR